MSFAARFALLLTLLCTAARGAPADPLFRRDNLAAWCIVPFDAKKRGPEERSAMLEKLGIKRLAYDYRAEHIPQFDAEMEALKKHGIELTAWWFPGTLNEEAKHILEVIKRHGVKPQLWVTGTPGDSGDPAAEADRLKPLCDAAASLGLKVALYNHGGWFGEPENQIRILEALRRAGTTNAGIVYNLHHGHDHAARFPALMKQMKPWLLALNLNGMFTGGGAGDLKIAPLGQGNEDLTWLRTILESGWNGPVGILNHTAEDAETRLLDNLDGLDWLRKELDRPGSGGPRPVPRSWRPPAPPARKITVPGGPPRWEAAFGHNPPAGLVIPDAAFHDLPVTVEIRAQVFNAGTFHILAAAGPKSSPWHWELYTFTGTGNLCAFLPGRGGNIDSGTTITDGAWHDLAAVIEPARIRLYMDGKQLIEAPLSAPSGPAGGAGFALGQLVEGGLGCDGRIARARVRPGVHEPGAAAWPEGESPGVWEFRVPPPEPAPVPAACDLPRAPLVPEQWPNRNHPVNRERTYDFYAKQALHFMTRTPAPELLAPYPGLDTGAHGHWGNQNEDTWRDGRWNDMQTGPCMAGILRGAGLTVLKGVAVRPGGAFAACFDPATASWPVVWKDGFIGFSSFRHGLHDGLTLQGTPLPADPALTTPQEAAALRYLGYYRHGEQTIFRYRLHGCEMLDALQVENGRIRRSLAPAASSPLAALTKGGPAQWPGVIETTGKTGLPMPGWPMAIDTLTLPFDNPWKALLFVSGHDFLPNGDIALCTMTGDVWTVSGVDASLAALRWRRIAAGLHQPLGLVVAGGKICVAGRDQITRLHDLNGDGETDYYECLSNSYPTPPGGHDFICGLERDAEGRFYTVSGHDGLLRITESGGAETIATGFRNPDGLSLDPATGTLTVSVQEGDWTPASTLHRIAAGGYYGYPGPRPGQPTLEPLLYLPRAIDNSSGGGTWGTPQAWTPLRGQAIHLSYGTGTHHLILRQTVDGLTQGAAVPLPGDFDSGVHRARFSPRDHWLYVSGMTGWGTYTPADGCLQRVRLTGSGDAMVPAGFEARENGILISFHSPPGAAAARPGQHFAQSWNYRYSQAYGSPEYSVRRPGIPGHDVLEITSAHLVNGGRDLFLEIPQLLPAGQIHLLLQPQPGVFRELFITAHRLAAPFTGFPGYQPVAKRPRPGTPPGPETGAAPGRALALAAAAGLQFAPRTLEAGPGERLSLTFSNPDALPHNWVLVKPGTLEATGDLANKLISSPEGAARDYVPASDSVLAQTRMVQPGGSVTLHFNAPSAPGDYPFLCTFPGHWMLMNGLLQVRGNSPSR